MAKIDIRSAFPLIPVHPTDRHLLSMKWKEYTFIDTCLPFGLRFAPKLFNILADLLTGVLTRQGMTFVLHYLNDFLTLGPPASNICQQNLNIIQKVCTSLGIPLALQKVEGPSTTLTFLGITLDTINMEARLSKEKLTIIRQLVTSWLNRKKATKREILSLVGLLQHAAKIIRCGRTFISWMYSTAAKIKELDYYTRLNRNSDQTFAGGIPSRLTGTALASCVCSQLYYPSMLLSKQTHQAHGAVVLTLIESGSSCSGQLTGSLPVSWPGNGPNYVELCSVGS